MDDKISGIAAKEKLIYFITNASKLIYKSTFFKKHDRTLIALLVIENNLYSIYNVLITPTELAITTTCTKTDDKEIETEFDKNSKELGEHSFIETNNSFDEITDKIKDIYAQTIPADEPANEKIVEMLTRLKTIFSMTDIAKKLDVSDAALYSWKSKKSFPRNETYLKLRNLYSSHFSINDKKRNDDTKSDVEVKHEETHEEPEETPIPNYTQQLNILKDLNQYITLCLSCAINDMLPLKSLIENQIQILSNSLSNDTDFKDLQQRFSLLKTTMTLQSFKIIATLIKNKTDELLTKITRDNRS